MGAGERHKMRDTIDMLFTTLTIRAVVITVIMIVRENGGYIVHAHQFREKANAYIIDMIRLMPLRHIMHTAPIFKTVWRKICRCI